MLLELYPFFVCLFNKCSQVAEMNGGVSALGNMCSSSSNIPGNRILHRQGLVCRGNSETVILVCEWAETDVSSLAFLVVNGGWWSVEKCGLKPWWPHVLGVQAMEAPRNCECWVETQTVESIDLSEVSRTDCALTELSLRTWGLLQHWVWYFYCPC